MVIDLGSRGRGKLLKVPKRLTRATPMRFLTHAQEFFSAGELVLNRATTVSFPAYFLLGRSIELSLKAFLLASGVEATELKSRELGHDLSALLGVALQHGLEQELKLDSQEAAIIRLLSYDYAEKWFEYPNTGGIYSLPLINVTEEVAKRLAYELKAFCSNASNN